MNDKTTGVTGDADERPRRPMSEERFEALLARALEVDVPDAPARQPDAPRPQLRRSALPRWAGLAAGVILVLGVVFMQLRPPGGTGSLPRDVIAHIRHEPAALVRTTEAVSPEAIERVMLAAGVTLAPTGATMSYVKLCPFRGEMVAHFVLQGAAGPVTVLLLPNEEVTSPMPVDEDGIQGTIAPLPDGGSIAIVGEPGESIEEIQNRVADAVRWRL
jgi:hypothetical protein